MRLHLKRVAWLAVPLAAACSDIGPTAGTSPQPSTPPTTEALVTASAGPGSSPSSQAPAAPPHTCGDPTAHVYHAYRLQLLDRCRTVTGVIAAVRPERDGDLHVLLSLDAQFRSMLRPANATGEHGDLVLEPICQLPVSQADAVSSCFGGQPPVRIPPIGTHVSATGAYVLDNDHGGWAELHPLFEIHAG